MGYDWPLCGYWSLRCRHCWLCFLLPQFSCAHVKLILILRFYCIMGWVLNMFICLFLFYFCFRYIHVQAPFRFLSSENPDNRMCVCVSVLFIFRIDWIMITMWKMTHWNAEICISIESLLGMAWLPCTFDTIFILRRSSPAITICTTNAQTFFKQLERIYRWLENLLCEYFNRITNYAHVSHSF